MANVMIMMMATDFPTWIDDSNKAPTLAGEPHFQRTCAQPTLQIEMDRHYFLSKSFHRTLQAQR